MLLVRIQAEHGLPEQLRRALLHPADTDVSVLHGSREFARLEWRAHALVFARWHVAAEDERLGAAADTAVKCPYTGFPSPRRRYHFAAQLAAARRLDPERERIVPTHRISCASRSCCAIRCACILPAGLTAGVAAALFSHQLALDPAYRAKALAVFVAGAALVLIGLPRHHPFASFGAANQVTSPAARSLRCWPA